MPTKRSTTQFQHIAHDAGLLLLSIIAAVLLVQTNVIGMFLASSEELGRLGAFVAGMFFTSLFTTAPAIVTLGEISIQQGVVETALWAALGAVVGDMLIFRFVKLRVADHLREILPHRSSAGRLGKILKFRFFRYLTFLAAAIIIASPLPDELGVAMLGMSKMREVYFVPLSFAFNFVGVLTIGLIAASRVS